MTELKQGLELYAIDPCVMEDTLLSSLTVGKKYKIVEYNKITGRVSIIDDAFDSHEFDSGKICDFFSHENPLLVKIKIKKLHPDAVIPKFARHGDAGADITATSRYYEEETGSLVYGTGLAFEIPYGYVGLLFPRSSISKTRFSLSNSVGVLDCGYRGEVIFKFNQVIGKLENPIYEVGDRIGQIVIQKLPEVEFIEVDELSESERGTGGYGSTGK